MSSPPESKRDMACWESQSYDVGAREFDQRRSERGDDEKFRLAMSRMTAGLYAMILTVLGFVFPLTYFISEGKKDNGVYLSVFHIYLYLLSLIFLLYTHVSIMYFKRQLRSCDVKLKGQYDKEKEPRDYEMSEPSIPYDQRSTPPVDGRISTVESHGTEIDADEGTQSLRRAGTLGTMEKLAYEGLEPEDLPIYYAAQEANFFMRLGLIAFGLASVVLEGFRLVKFAHTTDSWRCYGILFLIHTCLRMVFEFSLIFFLFKNHKIVLNFNRHLMRLGVLHVLVTAICICFYTVTMETAEEYYHLLNDSSPIAPSKTYKIYTNGNGTNITEYTIVAPYRPFRCHREQTMADAAAPYLYPCVVQFALLAVIVLRRIYCNMGSSAAMETEDRGRSILECQKATTGLFIGLLLLTCTVIATVFFLLFKPKEGSGPLTKEAPILVYFSVDLVVTLLAMLATIVGFCKTHRMQYAEHRMISFSELLLALGLGGFYALITFMMIPAITGIANPYDHGIYPRLQCASVVLAFVQATMQTIFICDSLRRRTVNRDVYKAKPGRSLVTFLLLCNLCLWMLRSFEWKSAHLASVFTNFYGTLAWVILIHVLMPLAIFFRFHSSVCLSQVWADVYRRTAIN